MFDTLSAAPLWSIVLFHTTIGAVGGIVLAKRGHSRLLGTTILLAVTLMIATGWATRWDWRTRTTPLGGTADTELRYSREALGTARRYNQARQRWMAMNNAERWTWRLTMFGVVSASLIGGSVPTLLWMKRQSAQDPRRTS